MFIRVRGRFRPQRAGPLGLIDGTAAMILYGFTALQPHVPRGGDEGDARRNQDTPHCTHSTPFTHLASLIDTFC